MHPMSQFGLQPFGPGPSSFGGVGLIAVLGVLVGAQNEFVVVFDKVPETLDDQAFFSATNPNNYVITAVDPTLFPPAAATPTVPPGTFVPTRFPATASAVQDDDDLKQIIVTANCKLEPRVRYTVMVSNEIVGAAGETFAGPTTWDFYGLKLADQTFSFSQVSVERYRDFDSIIQGETRPGETAASYRFAPNNDIALASARTSLRKRLYRRIFTDPGGFAWAPDYGVGVKVKKLIKAGSQQELANMVAEQVRKEPDVVNAAADVSFTRSATGTFVYIDLRVQQADSTITRVLFQEPVA